MEKMIPLGKENVAAFRWLLKALDPEHPDEALRLVHVYAPGSFEVSDGFRIHRMMLGPVANEESAEAVLLALEPGLYSITLSGKVLMIERPPEQPFYPDSFAMTEKAYGLKKHFDPAEVEKIPLVATFGVNPDFLADGLSLPKGAKRLVHVQAGWTLFVHAKDEDTGTQFMALIMPMRMQFSPAGIEVKGDEPHLAAPEAFGLAVNPVKAEAVEAQQEAAG
jgi:hypothetical protein